MTRRQSNHGEAALGLYGSADGWHLIKLERDGAGYRAAIEHTLARARNTGDRDEIDQLIARLKPEDRGLPIGVALADPRGMYRRIVAPPADKALLDKVVAAQVETMLPGRADQVRWGWCLGRGGKEIWVHAIARSDVDAALALLPDDMKASCVISDTMALTRALLVGESSSGDATLLLSIGVTHSDMVLVRSGNIVGVVSYDGGSDMACGDGPEHTDWTGWLSDARDELVSIMPPNHRPKSCLLVSPPDIRERLVEIGGEVIGLPVHAWNSSGGVVNQDGQQPASVIAASAAASCLEPVVPAITLAERGGVAGLDVRLARYAAMLGVWLLIAILALYATDRYRAGKTNDLLDSGALNGDRLSLLDRQIQVVNLLEMSGPIPLAIIDEIGQKTQGFMIESLSYERGGSVRIGGTLKSADAIGTLIENLAATRTLSAVQLQNQTGAGDTIRFDIIATVSPKYFGAFVEPKPQETSETKDTAK